MTPLRKSYWKNSYLDVVSRVLEIIIWSSSDRDELLMIISSRGTAPEIRSRIYLPGLHCNMVAFSVDAVFIAIGDQATIIEHFFKRRIRGSSLFQGWMQSWSIQLLKCWLFVVKSAKSCLSWSRLGFVVKFIWRIEIDRRLPLSSHKKKTVWSSYQITGH